LRMRPVTIGRQIPHVRSGHGSSIDRWCQCCLVPGRVRRLGARLPFTSPEGIASKEQPREHRNCYRVTHSTECNENVRLVQSVHSKIVVKISLISIERRQHKTLESMSVFPVVECLPCSDNHFTLSPSSCCRPPS
jgi:hypothetical protein